MNPTSESVARQEETAPASMVVFPRWMMGEKLSLEEIPKAESFMRLATNAFNYELLGEAAFRTVRDLAGNARCYRLLYSDLGEAIACLSDLADSDDI